MPFAVLLFFCVFRLFLLPPAAPAGESGITIEREDPAATTADRQRIARSIYRHDFENVRDPDTGLLLPQSASLNAELWPDFWEPVLAVGFPEYLVPTISIVEDGSGSIPGNYRDWPNHALRIEYDGTQVGIRTRTPVSIDPSLAYEYSVFVKDSGLAGARIRTGVDWLRIDPSAAQVLRSDEITDIRPGQTDWPVLPDRMLVNDPPAGANAARLFVIIDRDPASVGGAYHGTLWLDDAALRPLPKILVDAPGADDAGRRVIPVRYAGLFDNIPDPDNPGYFNGKRYTRQVEITDIHGQPVAVPVAATAPVSPDDDGLAVERIPFPGDKFGVYYFNIRLHDAEDNLATGVMRAVAVMRPPRERDGLSLQSSRPVFGLTAGVVPEDILHAGGFLRDILRRSGVKAVKLSPWDDSYNEAGANVPYYNSLAEEIRLLRSAGLSVYGMIRPPKAMFGDATLAAAFANRPERFQTILAEAGQQLGLFVDGWQWGDDGDGSLAGVPVSPAMEAVDAAVQEFAGGMPMANNSILGGESADAGTGAFPLRRTAGQGFFPESESAARLWPLAARVFPWLYEAFYVPRGLTYPPPELSALAPRPPQDAIEEAARAKERVGSWLFLESRPGSIHEPNAPEERKQLEELLVRAVRAIALSPDAVYLGNLFDPAKGLLRRDIMGTNTLETMARPTFLAASMVSELFEGVEYLGSLWLLPPFEAHVFRRPGTDEAIIALWHNDARDIIPLPRREIAEGPILRTLDWAGNAEPTGTEISVRRIPQFLTGLSANLALTRMSMRINPEMLMLAQTRRQNQMVEIVNHIPRQTPVLLRLRYAARLPGGAMENGWTVQPEEMRLNLLPFSTQLSPGRFRYGVSPDPNSQIQVAGPLGSDRAALKIAQAVVSFNTSPPADMLVYLPFRLQSELEVEVERLVRQNDPNFVTLQMKIRWFPVQAGARRTEIKLTPYYAKRGQMREAAAFPVTVKATPASDRGQNTAFEAVELRIPRRPNTQTWIGLEEESGSSYYIVDVTDYLTAE